MVSNRMAKSPFENPGAGEGSDVGCGEVDSAGGDGASLSRSMIETNQTQRMIHHRSYASCLRMCSPSFDPAFCCFLGS